MTKEKASKQRKQTIEEGQQTGKVPDVASESQAHPATNAQWAIKMTKEKASNKVQRKQMKEEGEQTVKVPDVTSGSQAKNAAPNESSKEMNHSDGNRQMSTWNCCHYLTLMVLMSFVFAAIAIATRNLANIGSIASEDPEYAVNTERVMGNNDDYLSDVDMDQNLDNEYEASTDKNINYNTLELELTLGGQESPLHNPMGISVSDKGDVVAVTDWNRHKVTVFGSSSGDIRFELDTRLDLDHRSTSNPVSVAIASSGHFYVTDFNSWVNVYHPDGSYSFQFPIELDLVNPNVYPRRHLRGHGISTDKSGRVFVGEYWNNRVSIHKPRGGVMASFNVSIEPRFISVSHNKIAIGCLDCRRPIQIVDYAGRLLVTLQNPFEDKSWSTRGVCFTKHRGDILVAGISKGKAGIYRFSSKGEFIDCVTREVSDPGGIDISADDKRVFVIDKRDVKVFQWR